MRPLVSFLLVLALLPGIAGGMLPAAQHCDHACCDGESYCLRNQENERGESHHRAHTAHVADVDPTLPRLVSDVSLSKECRETCGVLQQASPREADRDRRNTGPVVELLASSPLPRPLATRRSERAHAVAPRAPPLNQLARS